jgi:hypothetical protein
MSLRPLFQQQLDTGVPCDGDYLKGRTIDEVVAGMIEVLNLPVESDEKPQVNREELVRLVERRVVEWKAHQGQRVVYYLLATPRPGGDVTLQVFKIWESQIDRLHETLELAPNAPVIGDLPRLRPISA